MSFVTMELAREIENDRTLEQLTNKIKKIIPEKDAGYMGEEFEFRFNLEDILRCLEKAKETPSLYCVNALGDIFENYDNKNILITTWQLGKPLHEQSENTIKELNNLI